MLNVLLCSGYPGIPLVYKVGILVATVTLVLLIFIEWNYAIWMFEVITRAQGVALFRVEKEATAIHVFTPGLNYPRIRLHHPDHQKV